MDLSKQYNDFADNFSEKIDTIDNISRKEFYKKVNEISLDNKKVLDLACGDGADIPFYLSKGAQCFGIDSSEELIAKAIKNQPSTEFIVGDMSQTLYEDNSFDVVLSKYALGTKENPDDVFNEVFRILKKDGIFIYLTTHPMRLFLENKNNDKDYFSQEAVPLVCYGGEFVITEPSHTFNDFFSSNFISKFDMYSFSEHFDPQSADFPGRDTYPDFFIVCSLVKK